MTSAPPPRYQLKTSLRDSIREMAVNRVRRAEIDIIEELQLRRWARENYVAAERRNHCWHPVVLDEMSRRDREVHESPARLMTTIDTAAIGRHHHFHLGHAWHRHGSANTIDVTR